MRKLYSVENPDTLNWARKRKIGERKRSAGIPKRLQHPARRAAPRLPAQATKRLASSTPAAPRNGRNLDFFSYTRCSIANDCPGRRGGGGEEDPCHLQAGGCPAKMPVVVGLCAVWEPCGGAAALLSEGRRRTGRRPPVRTCGGIRDR